MSFATYADLKTLIASKLSRSDLTTAIVDAVAITHNQLMRDLRVREMETVDAGVTVSAETKALPANWLETRKIYVTSTSPRYELQYVSFDELIEKNSAADTGIPRYYTVVGGNMQFAPIPDSTYVLSHCYYVRDAQMSAGADTNWILTYYPDLYIYGSCLELISGEIQDDPRVALWQQKYAQAMAGVTRASQRAKTGPAMQVRPG